MESTDELAEIRTALVEPLSEIRTSQGIVAQYSEGAQTGIGQIPPHDYLVLQWMYLSDPIISSSIDLKSEVILSNGWGFRGENQRAVDRAYRKFKELNMYETLLNFTKQSELFGDSYLEPRWRNGDIFEIWCLQTVFTRIKYTQNGKVTGYLQTSTNTQIPATDTTKEWQPDELLHYSDNTLGSNIYSYSSIASMANIFSSLMMGNNYIKQIFVNLPPKMVHILKNASKGQMQSYKQAVLAAKSNVNQDFVVRTPEGTEGVDIKQFIVDFTKGGLVDILHYLREEVLARLRVPPELLGMGESSGRTEPKIMAFEMHIRTKQRRIANFINRELMPLLKLENVEFYFPPVMLTSEESILKNARNMIDAGIRSKDGEEEPAFEYLERKGFDIPENAVLQDPKKKDIEGMPSRERVGRKVGKEEGTEKNETGDSDKGKEKVKETQIRTAVTEEEHLTPYEKFRKSLLNNRKD